MLAEIVERYLREYPDEREGLKLLISQLAAGDDMSNRRNFTGHVVAGAVILSPDRRKILLIYHPTFGMWQQPGGHLDPGEAGPWESAEREAIEETGVRIARRLELPNHEPLLIESHNIAANEKKDEAEHVHHNFWYGFIAESEDLDLEDEVIKEARWTPVEKIGTKHILTALERLKLADELKA